MADPIAPRPPLTSRGTLTDHSKGFEDGNQKVTDDIAAQTKYVQENPTDMAALSQLQALTLTLQTFRSLQTNTTKAFGDVLKEQARGIS